VLRDNNKKKKSSEKNIQLASNNEKDQSKYQWLSIEK
jgi:hypothetical protein